MLTEEKAAAVINDWTLCMVNGDPKATVGNLIAALMADGDNVDAVKDHLNEVDALRQKLAGWHFAQEAMSPIEREVLRVGERLMALLDGGLA